MLCQLTTPDATTTSHSRIRRAVPIVVVLGIGVDGGGVGGCRCGPSQTGDGHVGGGGPLALEGRVEQLFMLVVTIGVLKEVTLVGGGGFLLARGVGLKTQSQLETQTVCDFLKKTELPECSGFYYSETSDKGHFERGQT